MRKKKLQLAHPGKVLLFVTMKKTDELLEKGINELGITPSKQQINNFITYLSELKKWNKAYNLTGLKKDEDIIIKHFLDSLLYLKAIPHGEITVADVGSGAGFPGIPIKIIRPEIDMYLVEPSRKDEEARDTSHIF
jgi:16S rRNA (guanine527-N7)-methyltransferase